MPTKVSKLGQKYGAKAAAAVQAHADDETTYGFVRLPGSIPLGIAQLQQCYFEEYAKGDQKGEYYFRAVGVVLEPTTPVLAQPANEGSTTMIVAGLTTSLMIPVCDAKRYGRIMTLDENVAEIMLHMRRLGGPDYTQGATIDDLEELAEGLVDLASFFKFTTNWVFADKDDATKNPPVKKGQRLDIINEKWLGSQGMDDYEAPEEKATTVKGGAGATAAKPSKNGTTVVNETVSSGGGVKEVIANRSNNFRTGQKPKETPAPEPEPEPEGGEVDLDALLADAKDKDSDTVEASGEELITIAVAAGIDEDWARKEAQSWDEVVDAIRASAVEEVKDEDKERDPEPEPEPEPESEEYVPEVGHTIGYCPIDPKTKKTGKEVSCKITKVNEKNETVELKSGKAVYKDVDWSDLVIPSESST